MVKGPPFYDPDEWEPDVPTATLSEFWDMLTSPFRQLGSAVADLGQQLQSVRWDKSEE